MLHTNVLPHITLCYSRYMKISRLYNLASLKSSQTCLFLSAFLSFIIYAFSDSSVCARLLQAFICSFQAHYRSLPGFSSISKASDLSSKVLTLPPSLGQLLFSLQTFGKSLYISEAQHLSFNVYLFNLYLCTDPIRKMSAYI